ncbi:hypothetical protein C1H76_7391 [Elsinoe australis]|uniref:Dynactin subunit 6 n=1 Tax=Elsinoe australis TaxID=40998 RepID=A0A4U7AVA4_9PEZI|nr:hypothetical protein C1H76_7391 [Elsinoe australis]
MSSRAARPVSVAAPISLAAKPPCKIDPTAIISDKAILVGSHPISIGANTVLHPFAKLDSTHSPLTIEDYCIVCERATVGHVNPANGDSAITIRSHVNIETGSTVEAVEIGKGCHIGAYAIVESDSKLGQFCKVTPACTLDRGTSLSDFTIVLDKGESRPDTTISNRQDIQDLKLKGQTMHVDTLRRLIPSNIAKWA